MVGFGGLPPLAGDEQCTVTVRDFDVCVRWQVRLWWVAFVRGAGKPGLWFNSDLRMSKSS